MAEEKKDEILLNLTKEELFENAELLLADLKKASQPDSSGGAKITTVEIISAAAKFAGKLGIDIIDED